MPLALSPGRHRGAATSTAPRRRRRTPLALTALAAALTAGALTLAAPAQAQTTGTGPEGQTVTVSTTNGLDPAGATVSVNGSGFDASKGIYVAFCVDNGPSIPPGPCGGGADTSGDSGLSHWISDNPPPYAEGLTTAYGPGGSFSVTLQVSANIGDIDCRVSRCAVTTRADHTRSQDRSQDVRVAVSFADPGSSGGGQSDNNPGSSTDGGENGTGAAPGTPEVGPTATATPDTGGPLPGEPERVSAAASEEQALQQVSASDSARWWWLASGLLLAAALVAVVLVRRRRSRSA